MTATTTRAALPDFEGIEVDGSAVRVTNAGDGLSDAMTIGKKALHIDQEVFYVLRGTVTQINHKADKDGDLTRVHTVRADDITEVDGSLASKLLTEAAEDLQRRKDEIEGQLRLDAEAAAEERERADLAATGNARTSNGGRDARDSNVVEFSNPPADS